MKRLYNKYIPFEQIKLQNRRWPQNTIAKAPIWCSVDLRDGNQALVTPMNMKQKLKFFKALCKMGFKQIEIGFPSASNTEYEICRELIEGGHIPKDVTIQVLVQAREHLIHRTFEAIKGAENVIFHFYNSTSVLQREVVFRKDMNEIIKIATDGAKLIKKLASGYDNIIFEYSPESFSGTEVENSVRICEEVMNVFEPTNKNRMILNLPDTVQMCTPNTFADQIEYFINNLKNRESAIISVHPHNDRGTAVAAAELALLAGAERVEGTLFGNGERTGNVDIITLGLNMFTQGVEPKLDFSDLPIYKYLYEKCTGMHVDERQPYSGDLVFTAFSGSHQDAINKGIAYMRENNSEYWKVPYLPIDPADIGREYEPIIRINSQSGKGGAAFVLQSNYGYILPKDIQADFGPIVKRECDAAGRELQPNEILRLFEDTYINVYERYKLINSRIFQYGETNFEGTLEYNGKRIRLMGSGNGPIDAFFNSLMDAGIRDYKFVSYSEHAVGSGSDSKAIAYIHLKKNGSSVFGAGIENNINSASILAVLNAINRAELS